MFNSLKIFNFISAMLIVFFSPSLFANGDGNIIDLTSHGIGYAAILFFGIAYCLVMLEDVIHLRKSKPVLIAAGIASL